MVIFSVQNIIHVHDDIVAYEFFACMYTNVTFLCKVAYMYMIVMFSMQNDTHIHADNIVYENCMLYTIVVFSCKMTYMCMVLMLGVDTTESNLGVC